MLSIPGDFGCFGTSQTNAREFRVRCEGVLAGHFSIQHYRSCLQVAWKLCCLVQCLLFFSGWKRLAPKRTHTCYSCSWFNSHFRVYTVAFCSFCFNIESQLLLASMIMSQYLFSRFPSHESSQVPSCVVCATRHIWWILLAKHLCFLRIGYRQCLLIRIYFLFTRDWSSGMIPISMQPWRFSAIATRSVVLLLHRAVFQHLLQDFPEDAQALSRLGNPGKLWELAGAIVGFRWILEHLGASFCHLLFGTRELWILYMNWFSHITRPICDISYVSHIIYAWPV